MSDPRLVKVYDETVPNAKPGFYRAVPVAWRLEEPSGKIDEKTGLAKQSQPINVQYALLNRWETPEGGTHEQGAWSDPFGVGWFVYGRTWIVNGDGSLNERNIEDLAKAKLWNGDIDALGGNPPEIAVVIELDFRTFQQKTRLEFQGVQADAAIPVKRSTAFTPTEPSLLAAARARFGSQARAIASGAGAAKGPVTVSLPQPPPQMGMGTPHVQTQQMPPAPQAAPAVRPPQHFPPPARPVTIPPPPQQQQQQQFGAPVEPPPFT